MWVAFCSIVGGGMGWVVRGVEQDTNSRVNANSKRGRIFTLVSPTEHPVYVAIKKKYTTFSKCPLFDGYKV